ncbi:MAG: aldehyde dehydrogenase family protein [Promethearchaeota archaeon]
MSDERKRGRVLTSINPATLEIVGTAPDAPPEALPAALDAARRAQREWTRTPLKRRRRLLARLTKVLASDWEGVARVVSSETGKPRLESLNSDVMAGLGVADYCLWAILRLFKPKRLKGGRLAAALRLLGRSSFVHPRPVGVVGVIAPWNFPFGIPFTQAVMAVTAGNAVLLKPSSETPLTGLAIGELFARAGFPEGLVQVLTGSGSGIGNALVESPVDRLVFTGSVAVGRTVMAKAAQRLTPVTLELGGKDPLIVLDDADLDRTVMGVTWASFLNAGQVCVGVKRIYVHQSLYDQFLEKFQRRVEALKLGWGWDDPSVSVGPLINEAALLKVEAAVERAKEQGARVLCGGRRAPGLKGYFFEPTVLVDVDQKMDCVREEIFSPVVVAFPFGEDEEAVRLANDSRFALSASVWTKDVDRGVELAKKLTSGTVIVNNHAYTYGLGFAPWGGSGESGFGRTHGELGFAELVEPHHVHVDRGKLPTDPWWSPCDAEKLSLNETLTRVAFGGQFRKIFGLWRQWRRLGRRSQSN